VLLFQSARVRLREATYFGSVLRLLATGSSGSVAFGQLAAKISYVLRTEHERFHLVEDPVHVLAEGFVEEGHQPAAVAEVAASVLVRATRRLVDAVKRHELGQCESHARKTYRPARTHRSEARFSPTIRHPTTGVERVVQRAARAGRRCVG
jgi:hypothetical protein